MSGHESPSIPGGGEHVSNWDHPDIVGAFEPLDPTDANNQAQQYYEISELWDEGLRTFARGIRTSIEQAWSGAAAQQSKDSIQNYVTDAEQLTSVLNELSTRVTEAASAITQTKNALPDPVVITWTSWLWPPNRMSLQREQTEEEQAARDAMNNYYVQPFKTIDSSIPILPAPVSPTSSPDITVPPGGFRNDWDSGSGSDSGSGDPSSGDPTGTTPEGEEPGEEEQPGSEEQQPDGQDDSSSDQDDSSTDPSSRDPAGTNPAGTNPASANPTDPGRTVPSGSAPSPGSGSPGSGSPGSPGSSTPQPGRSIPGGAVATPTAPGTSSTSAAASAGGAGRSGMGGMGSPGSRGGQDDESSHKIPDYLITQQNTEELLGDIPPSVPGGVIGGEPA